MSRFVSLLTQTTPGGGRARALLGAIVWLIFVAIVQPGWAETLLLLAPLVIFPLGLPLLLRRDERADATILRWATVVQLPAALALPGAFALSGGATAVACSLPWVGFTLLLALAGLTRLGWGVPRTIAATCEVAALVFPTVGGGWLLLSVLGARPLGFTPEIVRATAIHFHYAGFALPLLAALTAQARPGIAAGSAGVGVVAGVPLVALGITLAAFGVRMPEWLAAWFLAAVCVPLAVQQCRGGVLLAISGLALLSGMVLAALYAWGNYWGPAWLDIPLMIRTHGAINALGFALPGVLAWNLRGAAIASETRRASPVERAKAVEVG